MTSEILYVGVKGTVVAIDKKAGKTMWQTPLKGGAFGGARFVTLLVEGDFVYAHTQGELFCLNARSGQILWNNELEGLGYDIASLASEGSSSPSLAALAYLRNQQAQQSAASSSSHGGG